MQTAARNVILCKGKIFEHLRKFQHALYSFVVADNPVADFTAGFYDQAGNVDKGVHKSFEFHSDNSLAQRSIWYQQAVPDFQIPGHGCDDHIGPVGNQTIRRCLNRSGTIFQLFDIVFVVSPIPVKFDKLTGGTNVVIGDIEKIAVFIY